MIVQGDARDLSFIDAGSVACVVTSPPYLAQRVYGDSPDEIGRTTTLAGYLAELGAVFDQLGRVVAPTGFVWLNIGDKSNNSGGSGGDWKRSSTTVKGRGRKVGPFRDRDFADQSFLDVPGAVVRELLARGWRLRLPIVWDQQSEEAADLRHIRRPRWSHEMIYLLAPPGTARGRFYASQLPETGSVWHFRPGGDGPSHLAPFPDELARRCILATTLPGDLVLDPFSGSGTTARVAEQLGRRGLGVELYHDIDGAPRTVGSPL
jgi:site-specific DNA-methyltransferase (cytosine-N4-specific)